MVLMTETDCIKIKQKITQRYTETKCRTVLNRVGWNKNIVSTYLQKESLCQY